MINVVILGAGNVATHLLKAFEKSNEVSVLQVYARSKKIPKSTVPYTTEFSKIVDADIYIIAVSDDSIQSVSKELINKKGLVVHTSGSVPMKALHRNKNYGVFYPLQTFSKDVEIDFSTVPICLEAKTKTDLNLLKSLGNSISQNVYEVSSEQRESLHLAAVFVNNFTNHLYYLGQEICHENNLSFDLLKPLILETVNKLETSSPFNVQTGPAKRGDKGTINSHLERIKDENIKNIYSIMSQSISKTYGKKL
ncbi:putative short-subunit dehydrogenase-like oxidoreductase (DUF2520 family) [Saonia flava]|uniref:Putative short-subunit dehydrogenase-like oxidoreductase (DUF2520 family) n=1 Tax=Saonia flava TaxID=523696 RepID=A0A846QPZ7_9FLAO|nr:Rossmann-like and DUF2520 domain-containing protein [Saonia flava]NJB70161.1 putative short-subunit dehydrogenase-like oxidoreductase (DUF2520 family) [Saonia flava]